MTDDLFTEPIEPPDPNDEPADERSPDDDPSGAPTAPMAPPRRLRRPAGTPLGGVAAGTARYLDLDPGLVRVVFVISALLGGFGLFVYLAGWFLLRTDDDPDPRPFVLNGELVPIVVGAVAATIALSIALSADTFSAGFIVPAILVGVGFYLLNQRDLVDPSMRAGAPTTGGTTAADDAWSSTFGAATTTTAATTTAPPPPSVGSTPSPPPWGSVLVEPDPDPGPSAPRPPITAVTIAVAAATVGGLVSLDQFTSVDVSTAAVFGAVTAVIGAGLVVSAFVGRAWGLYPVAAIALGGLVIATTVDGWDLDERDFGTRSYVPTTPQEVRPRYELGAGELILDLRQVDLRDDTDIEIDVGAGSVLVHVPDDLTLVLDAHTVIGEVIPPEGNGISGSGTSVRERYESREGAPLLDLEIDVALGQIEVIRD